jgi:hypothetical protein
MEERCMGWSAADGAGRGPSRGRRAASPRVIGRWLGVDPPGALECADPALGVAPRATLR